MVVFLPNKGHAQELFDFDKIFQGQENQVAASVGDISQYLGAYLTPFGEGLVVGMNNGWYNTAATHESFGLDITAGVNFVLVPKALSSFEVSELNLQSFETNATTLPNIFGGSAEGATFVLNTSFNGTEVKLTEVAAIDGVRAIGQNWDLLNLDKLKNIPVPVPTINIGVGIIKNTDINLRYVGAPPSITRGINAFSWGVGVKHDIKQWIPGVKLLPFSLSAFAGYTQSVFDIPMSVTPSSTSPKLSMRGHSFNAQILISKKLLFFTPYAGVGVNIANADVAFRGNYNLPVFGIDGLGNTFQNIAVFDLENIDPIQYRASGARATVGARIKLWLITIHGDYTFTTSGYNVFSTGLGLSWR